MTRVCLRHGDEGALCGMMAILEAIDSVVHSKNETPISIVDGPVKIVFLSKEPIVLVGVSRKKESIKWILKQLDYLYHHVWERGCVCTNTQYCCLDAVSGNGCAVACAQTESGSRYP